MMTRLRGLYLAYFCLGTHAAFAQLSQVQPQVITRTDLDGKVALVEVANRFVTTIRLPDSVNSVVVGDPSEFQVEHSEHEPKLVFVKATSQKPAETNLLISMTGGHQVSLLLINRGESVSARRGRVDFLLRYEPSSGFFVAPSGFPFALVGETVPLSQYGDGCNAGRGLSTGQNEQPVQNDVRRNVQSPVLDKILEEQTGAPLPVLYGQRVNQESFEADRVRAGVSRVIDLDEQVIASFSIVNQTKRAILLMPPQVQLGGKATSGKLIHRREWSSAEQLPVLEFRLSRRRLGPGERADGVVVFDRPPYKQSNEMLLLQVAESGAVDRPALAPIGFGVSILEEDRNARTR